MKELDYDSLVDYIKVRTKLDRDTIELVLDTEFDYLEEMGFTVEED